MLLSRPLRPRRWMSGYEGHKRQHCRSRVNRRRKIDLTDKHYGLSVSYSIQQFSRKHERDRNSQLTTRDIIHTHSICDQQFSIDSFCYSKQC